MKNPRINVSISGTSYGNGYVARATYEPWRRVVAEGIVSNTERNALRQLRRALLAHRAWIETSLKMVDNFEEHLKASHARIRGKR